MFEKLLINKDLSKEEVDIIIEDNLDEYDNEIKKIIELLKAGTKKENIKFGNNNQYFINKVYDDVDDLMLPYNECKFLRKMSIKKYKHTITYSIDNLFIKYELPEVVKEELSITDIEYNCLRKFIATLRDHYFVKRYSNRYFIKNTKDMFDLDDEKVDIIIETFEDKKDIIKESLLFEMGDNINELYRFLIMN